MKSALPPLISLILFAQFQSTCADTVAHWKFEEGVPDRIASAGIRSILDSSANRKHGTALGSPVYRLSGGTPTNLALEFNGSTDSVFVPDDPVFQLTESLTIEAIVTVHQFSGGPLNQIVFRGDTRDGIDPYYLAFQSDGRISFQISTESPVSGNRVVLMSPVIPLNQRVHIAGTVDDATGKVSLFINHQRVASARTSVRPYGALDPRLNPGIGIGNTENNSRMQFLDGLIDEVRISDSALDPAQFISLLEDADRDGIPDDYETNTGTLVSATDTGTDPENPDTDGDGLSDGQEVMQFASSPHFKDSDSDGFNDKAEVDTGKSPTDPNDTPDAVAVVETAVEFTFYSKAGAAYRIEWSHDLETWTPFPEIITGDGDAVTRFYSTRDQPRRFFRAERVAP